MVGTTVTWRDLVAHVDLVRLQQPDPDARIPGPGRVDDRTIDGSCNPYLAAAAPLAAGLDGIESGLDAGEPNADNLYAIPYDEPARAVSRRFRRTSSWRPSSSPRTRCSATALGPARDEDYVDYFIKVKRDEDPLPRAGDALGDPRVPDPVLGLYGR